MINWNLRKYTEQEFKDAWVTSLSIAEVARKLNLNKYGSTYQTLKNTATECGLNRDHMTGQGWSAGKRVTTNKARPIEEVLVYGRAEVSNHLRLRLLKDGIKKHRCELCFNTTWLNRPIALELDHINGDRLDHRLENLRVICPNCHAQTETYRGKNIGKIK